MDKNKVVYLFGAGASRNALPIINEIPARLNVLVEKLQLPEYLLDDKPVNHLGIDLPSLKKCQDSIIESLKWLHKESKNHASIDTFAKKLFVKNKTADLNRLKNALSIFFICEQALNKPDNRYDSFYASILQKDVKLPSNIKILSWNYDYQFELALSEFTDNKNINTQCSTLRVIGKKENYDVNDGFGIIKLNGSIGFIHTIDLYRYTSSDFAPFNKLFVEEMTKNYACVSSSMDVGSLLSFSWETEHAEKSIAQYAVENTHDAVALVVIGYSFPFFNRDVDREIINNMSNLKRVYFQAPDADTLKERFQAIRKDLTGIELIPKYDVGQFFLPNEL